MCGLLTPKWAWAWAPMCDLSASTAIAPMVAPPVDGGEINPCPPGFDIDDDVRPALHKAELKEGRSPQPPSEELSGHELLRCSLVRGFELQLSRGAKLLQVLPFSAEPGGPRVGFTRLVERPPCA